MHSFKQMVWCGLLVLSACTVGSGISDVGEDCLDSEECRGELGCMPTNADAPQGQRVCMPPPDGFDNDRCKAFYLGDPDAICDCGCGALDPDCASDAATACAPDDGNHCPDGTSPIADDNSRCQ